MEITYNKSLKNLNTFGIDAHATGYIAIHSERELTTILSQYRDTTTFFILSGGSNMLLTQNIDALVLHLCIKGITTDVEEDKNTVLVTANAGENWHDFVQFCIRHNYGGIENLSLIPGYVGSAPIQNIGAYGVELKDTFVKCETIEIASGQKKTFTAEECNFGYRNSIFKNELKNKYIITQITLRLTTRHHQLYTSYGAIENALAAKNISQPSIQEVAEAVIEIRKSKLPDPAKIGNSGSFFKNPIVTIELFNTLQQTYTDIPHYHIDNNTIKIPAGWLIEQCGFKGKKQGNAGVHSKQALVLVNYGDATGKEILTLSTDIKASVLKKFNISLETEVNIF